MILSLIVKPGKDKTRYMLGCTNYKKDGTGCSRTMSPGYFYDFMGIKDDTPAPPVIVPKGYNIDPNDRTELGKKPEAERPEATEPHVIQTPDIKPVDYEGHDLNAIIGTILQTLSEISQRKYYGETMLVDVLRGSHNKRILTDGLTKSEGYGKLYDIPREDVTFLVDWMIENEYIRKTRGPYPVLHPTYDGLHYSEIITRQKLQALKRKMETKHSPVDQ